MSDQPAFPNSFMDAGMTLRDYFAAKAMQAWVSAAAFNQSAEDLLKKSGIKSVKDTEAFLAMIAYDMADAMLTERAKREEKP